MITVALAVTGNYVINDPVVESYGFMYFHSVGTDEEIREIAKRAVENYDYENGNKEELAAAVKRALKIHIYKKTKQSPMIAVAILDV